ncbi:hypothetical protein J6590_077084 [Homalodisca vitripennis]|nr:hypothetical protein J6590_077084 [Homalodisca vitripennis]
MQKNANKHPPPIFFRYDSTSIYRAKLIAETLCKVNLTRGLAELAVDTPLHQRRMGLLGYMLRHYSHMTPTQML